MIFFQGFSRETPRPFGDTPLKRGIIPLIIGIARQFRYFKSFILNVDNILVQYPSPLEGRGEGEGDDEGFQGIPPLNILLMKQDSIFFKYIFLYFLLAFKLYTEY